MLKTLKNIWKKHCVKSFIHSKDGKKIKLNRADRVAVGYLKNLQFNRTLKVVGRGAIAQDPKEIKQSPQYKKAVKSAKKIFNIT